MAVALDLTRLSGTALARAIRTAEVSSREVVEAHIELLERAQPRIRALACERFSDARAEAVAADERVAAADDPDELPPLLGVPCTVKESMALAGMPNCAGLVARREHLATETAPPVERVMAAGAIPLGVTNTSEMTMWIESVNHVYGRTGNAYDARRTAGGSSGGEGAAVGSGGSPFGLGSDIAGSIRIPAFFNGVFGHKPSVGLVPLSGQFPSADGDAARMLAVGPLVRRAEDLWQVLKVIAGPDGQDPLAVEMELGDPADVSFDGLDVVVGESTSFVPVSLELRAARERAAGALAHAGARVRHEPMKELRRALELYLAVLSDGSPTSFTEILSQAGLPDFSLRRAALDLVRRRSDHTLPTLMLVAAERLNDHVPEGRTRRALAAARSLREQFEGIIGDGVMLHPPHARVAPRHGATVGRTWAITATAIFNVLQVPATQVPLGLNQKGLPLGVQVVAGPGQDHVAIACALELERTFGGWVPPPGS